MWEWSNPASYHGAVRVECIIQIDAFYLTVKAGSLAIAERTLSHESQALRPYGRVIEWDVCFFWHPGSLELNMPNCFA